MPPALGGKWEVAVGGAATAPPTRSQPGLRSPSKQPTWTQEARPQRTPVQLCLARKRLIGAISGGFLGLFWLSWCYGCAKAGKLVRSRALCRLIGEHTMLLGRQATAILVNMWAHHKGWVPIKNILISWSKASPILELVFYNKLLEWPSLLLVNFSLSFDQHPLNIRIIESVRWPKSFLAKQTRMFPSFFVDLCRLPVPVEGLWSHTATIESHRILGVFGT